MLAAGGEGASLGTALLATPEAVEVPETFKEQIVLSDGQDTAFTRLYDLLGTRPWPEGIAARVYRNRLVRQWDGRDAEVLARREELASDVADARARHDTELSAVYMGQGAGHVTAIRPAAEVMRDICDGAEAILRGLAGQDCNHELTTAGRISRDGVYRPTTDPPHLHREPAPRNRELSFRQRQNC